MGLCFSKKKPPATPAGGAKKPGKIADDKAKKTAQQPKKEAKPAAGEPAAAGKAAVLVVRPKDAAAGGEERKKRPGSQEPPAAAEKPLPVVVVPSAPVRTSSCTKEEVDAILIQCGRLSRSSSGTGRAASSDAAGGHRRRRSVSKRSYDFDQDARSGGGADEDWERQGAAAAVSRPSPHRGSPQRKRSGSRERSGGGGSGSRRASRSPGRRTDGAAASAATAGSSGGGERARQQPGKMVSVPAREKGRAPSPAAASGKRCASPRSSSPARMVLANENAGCGPAVGPTPALSRSSSRKAEQSPYRRNPMAELDENSLRNNSNHSGKPQKKSIENAVAATPKKKAMERGKEPTTVAASCRSAMEKPEIAEEGGTIAAASETRAPSSKTTATRTASIVADSLSQRHVGQPGSSRSRRASRDFDQNSGSYTTQLLEDIQNYHQQSTSAAVPATPATPSFSLPACVAKACSIVEAVADLNSSSSENRTYEYEPGLSADDKGSVNAPLGSDCSVEPSAARKPVQPVRDFRVETEPQESAGSNSVSGHQWTPSWEPTSAESTDRTWSTGDEVVEQSGSHGARCSPMNRPRQSKQRPSQPEPSGRGSRAGSGNGGNTLHRGRSAHRGSSSSVASGRSGVRVVSAAS
ncbi:uncharacterized protein C2845_PM12G10680 [Panicum miliaceum]|uniref:Uncharacterized protein n=1 Tax=Panicum miliaceum TaxID=4540 RepID=A0A3L6QE60_PANMI|nr:uncharacterized protein C2845_PM12G10680 [Panicum miliaceum]